MLTLRALGQALASLVFIFLFCSTSSANDEIRIESGLISGTTNADQTVRLFKGIPFAAPPVGDLRWKAPQPVNKWPGVRQADKFGPACLQADVFGDIYPRENKPSEDCLNLAIWVPAKPASAKLPVFVWFYGGGFVAGANSEARYDGEGLAKKGVIVVNPNYRLGVFGYYSHPELTKESPHHASGNYTFLDQVAALEWVKRNIAAFGGDPQNVTIGGESAGSFSVSILMASPLSKDLFQRAIGESGAFFPSRGDEDLRVKPLAKTEEFGVKFAKSLGASTLAEMRAKSADELLKEADKLHQSFDFSPNIDGYFLPEDVRRIYAKGAQAHVPLLAGWNRDENKASVAFAPTKPTPASFAQEAKKRFGKQSGEFLKLYPANTNEETIRSAEQLASDDFIIYSTWKWLNSQLHTGAPVYAYQFDQVPATKPGAMVGTVPASEVGARHAGEIEYVFQTLKSVDVPWTEGDFRVSDAMSSYWVNFIKSGNPNAKGLPEWPLYKPGDGFQILHLSADNMKAAPEANRARYLFLDARAPK